MNANQINAKATAELPAAQAEAVTHYLTQGISLVDAWEYIEYYESVEADPQGGPFPGFNSQPAMLNQLENALPALRFISKHAV